MAAPGFGPAKGGTIARRSSLPICRARLEWIELPGNATTERRGDLLVVATMSQPLRVDDRRRVPSN